MLTNQSPLVQHARTTREVIFTRLDSAQASLRTSSSKELWTATLVARHPRGTRRASARRLRWCWPTLIAVGSLDTIITPTGASQGFGSWRARLKGVRVLTMEGVGTAAGCSEAAAGARCSRLAAESSTTRRGGRVRAHVVDSPLVIPVARVSRSLASRKRTVRHRPWQLRRSYGGTSYGRACDEIGDGHIMERDFDFCLYGCG